MKEFLSSISMDQWVKVALAIIAFLIGGKIIFTKIKKSNKAKVKNVENSTINIHQKNK